MLELLVIRHGETDLNREPRFQGQIDMPLNATGQWQAERLAERLAREPVDALIASDLERARQTAAPLAQAWGLPLASAGDWREQGFGIFEGLHFDEVRSRHPELWEQWLRFEPDFAPPGGETVRRFQSRVNDALAQLAERSAGRRVAIVTHGGVLDMLWRRANALPLAGARECAIPNTGLNRLRWDGERLEIHRWADAEHLG